MSSTNRPLGRTGIRVFPIGLGCMGMSEFYGPSGGDSSSIKVIHRALDRGITLLDTADMYGLGRNEELLGKALRGHRERAVLTTKFGILRGDDGSRRGVCGRPDYVKSACDASLERLGLDSIDVYYQHRVDPDVPIEETVGAMSELVKAGKVRYLGLSEASTATIERAHSVHPITSVQSELSLWTRDYENDVLPLCEELGISFVAYSPLGRGFLTGQIRSPEDLASDDFRRGSPRFTGDAFQANIDAVERLQAWAAERSVTAGQLALAWILTRGERVLAIPGTRSLERLDENQTAAELALSASDLAELDALLPPGAFTGTRYPQAAMQLLNR